MKVENEVLRNAALMAIKNYMHYELIDITGGGEMLPWMQDQANELLNALDRAIKQTKDSPLAKMVKR